MVVLRYCSKSHTAALCLKRHLADDKVFEKLARVEVEPYMFVSATPFVAPIQAPVTQIPAPSEEEIKKEQIS